MGKLPLKQCPKCRTDIFLFIFCPYVVCFFFFVWLFCEARLAFFKMSVQWKRALSVVKGTPLFPCGIDCSWSNVSNAELIFLPFTASSYFSFICGRSGAPDWPLSNWFKSNADAISYSEMLGGQLVLGPGGLCPGSSPSLIFLSVL